MPTAPGTPANSSRLNDIIGSEVEREGGDSQAPSFDGSWSQADMQGGIGAIGAAGQMAHAIGVLGRSNDLGQFGSILGQGATLMNAVNNPTLANAAPIALQALGASPVIGNAVLGGIQSGLPGALKGGALGAIAMANPALAALSVVSGFFGGPTLQSLLGALLGNTQATAVNQGVNYGLSTQSFGPAGSFGGISSLSDLGAYGLAGPEGMTGVYGGQGLNAASFDTSSWGGFDSSSPAASSSFSADFGLGSVSNSGLGFSADSWGGWGSDFGGSSGGDSGGGFGDGGYGGGDSDGSGGPSAGDSGW